MLIGRGSECEELLALLERVRLGTGGGRLLRGPPGIGKTTLLSWTVQQALSFRVVSLECDESSRQLPLSTLRDLVSLGEDEVEKLLPEHRGALLGILGRETSTADAKGLGAALVALLSSWSETAPLLVVIDDLHWVDATSLDAIVFAHRRLDHERALILAAARDGLPDPIESMTTLAVAGLSPFDVAQLLDGIVEPRVTEELTLATDGNPLAINEIVGHLTTAQREGREPLPAFAPIGDLLRDAFATRAADLSAEQRTLLLCVAADSRVTMAELTTAAGTDQPDKDIGLLCERGLLKKLSSGRLEFDHPLIRSAIYLSATPSARRQAHERLAGAVPSSDVGRRAWHLASAAAGPDESAAAELDIAAAYAAEHGDALAAGTALVRAAELSTAESRSDRLVRAGMAFSQAGAIHQALDIFDQALATATDPLIRADIELLRAIPYLFAYGPAQLQESLVKLGDQLLTLDAARSAMADVLAALVSFSCCRMNEVQALCLRAMSSNAESRGPTGDLATMLSAIAQALRGELTDTRSLLLEHARNICDSPDQVETSSAAFLATTLAWTGDWAMSSRLISTLVRQSHQHGEVVLLLHLLAVRSDLNFRIGQWAAALGDEREERGTCPGNRPTDDDQLCTHHASACRSGSRTVRRSHSAR